MISNLDTLIRSTRASEKQAFATRGGRDIPTGAAEIGFHIYGKLKTRIAFAAAENDAEAIHYLRILHALAGVTYICARDAGDISLLELQGEVVHLFIPAQTASTALDRAVKFCGLLTNAVYEHVCPLAEEDLFGFSMAIDHGPTVFIANRSPSADSIVSLAPAANAPAKRLFAGVSAGHVAIPNRFLGRGNPGWHEQYIRSSETFAKIARESGVQNVQVLAEEMRNLTAAVLTEVSGVRRGNREFLSQHAEEVWNSATVFRGFFFRADLHDFSKRIADAWARGADAVKKEVEFFQNLMNDTSSFLTRSRFYAFQLPWAGDCANLLLKSKTESYQHSRESLPAVFASDWHREMTDPSSRQWLISEAGGGDGNGTGEGNGGAVVVSPILLDDRRFMLTGGWSVRKSLAAQDIAGTRVGDAIIPNSDYHALDHDIQGAFTNAHDEFWKASPTALAKLPDQARGTLSYRNSLPFVIGGVERPKPRPYYDRRYMAGRD